MERKECEYDPEACPPGILLKMEDRDKEWVVCLIKKLGALYRQDNDPVYSE
jgi:hypothetical protein